MTLTSLALIIIILDEKYEKWLLEIIYKPDNLLHNIFFALQDDKMFSCHIVPLYLFDYLLPLKFQHNQVKIIARQCIKYPWWIS